MADRVESYRDLLVWQRGMDLAADVYELTKAWPRAEIYGLTSQVRRSAASIPANIAEGYGRASSASYAQFLKIARGSLKELETHLLLAERVGIASKGCCAAIPRQADELGKMLGALIRKIDAKS